jgi:hypothetical protein
VGDVRLTHGAKRQRQLAGLGARALLGRELGRARAGASWAERLGCEAFFSLSSFSFLFFFSFLFHYLNSNLI